MSASLVGSEMCIRDRKKVARTSLGHCSDGERRDARRSSQLDGAGPLAVSYTHLTLPTICSV
eukprot:9206896-Alexandrium_andersonii.AAC.1